jgi:transcriptional regulator with XRE-family HTH domain
MDENFAARLTKARIAMAWSQTDLGKAAHIAPTQISRYEAGRAVPRAYVLGKLALALNVRVEWLATGEGDMSERPIYSAKNPPPPIGLSFDEEETAKLEAAAKLRGVSFDEFVSMAVREALAATENLVRRGAPPTLEEIHTEIAQQRTRLEELAEMLKEADAARKPKP